MQFRALLTPQEVIIVCVYLAIVPTILVVKQLKHDMQAAKRQENKKLLELAISEAREVAEKMRQGNLDRSFFQPFDTWLDD